MKKILTSSQTVGPFFHFGLKPIAVLSSEDIPGEKITITGAVLDGTGARVNDAMIEIWQANSRGKYDHPEDQQDRQTTPGFTGFGRVFVNGDGGFEIKTIKPGPVDWLEPGQQAPHINISLFARGVLRRMATRIYFADDPATGGDPVLNLIDGPGRRNTLLAQPVDGRPGAYTWNIVLKGEQETVFFEV
ncbi:MAG: protocatechuate 3,4-dioxygenase subunit alpha [SAR324 cluster bacterium]|nr:protocatechuate 3,4-dioxygenase subunit alpha [SAR324 cluster bacterium]MCH8884987.1 protocatechuate 3,4-dioxygenase subunit alpha [SAR324 cluster bacterium]